MTQAPNPRCRDILSQALNSIQQDPFLLSLPDFAPPEMLAISTHPPALTPKLLDVTHPLRKRTRLAANVVSARKSRKKNVANVSRDEVRSTSQMQISQLIPTPTFQTLALSAPVSTTKLLTWNEAMTMVSDLFDEVVVSTIEAKRVELLPMKTKLLKRLFLNNVRGELLTTANDVLTHDLVVEVFVEVHSKMNLRAS